MDEATREILTPIAEALRALGYPDDALWDAAMRMSWAPDVASDLVNFAQQPAASRTIGGAWTKRQLPGGLTITALAKGYAFEPAAAFLMAAALTSHTDEAQAALTRLLAEGRWELHPDGRYEHVIVPAAEDLPVCPTCAVRVVGTPKFCRDCGSPLVWRDGALVDEEPAKDDTAQDDSGR